MLSTLPMNTHVAKAIKICGSQEALAKKLGLTQRAISYLLRIKRLPKWHVIPLERATKGKVPRWITRPDLYKRGKRNGRATR